MLLLIVSTTIEPLANKHTHTHTLTLEFTEYIYNCVCVLLCVHVCLKFLEWKLLKSKHCLLRLEYSIYGTRASGHTISGCLTIELCTILLSSSIPKQQIYCITFINHEYTVFREKEIAVKHFVRQSVLAESKTLLKGLYKLLSSKCSTGT